MIQAADTVGVFQIESRAQMSMLPRLRPRCFYDLVIEVAIVRPGPIQGDMVHPYLRRRAGDEQVEYPNDEVRAVLEKTLGVPIFQEQAMRLAVVAAGFTPGEADQLRRAMGAWRKTGVIDRFHRQLVDGMLARGYTRDYAERVFNQIRGFGEYGFPESHSASFALIVYVSAWLKHYYPAAFCAALLNSQPMGFYAPAQLVADSRAHGVEVRSVDVNASDWECTLEPMDTGDATPRCRPALRLGFRMLSGLSRATADQLLAERSRRGPFSSFEEFAQRTGLSNAVLERLAAADVFRSVQRNRREAYWEALPAREEAPLFRRAAESRVPAIDETPPRLPHCAPLDEITDDYRTVGLSLKGHPVQFLRAWLNTRGVLPCGELATHEPDRKVRVAGLVLLRQRPGTAGGITFMTIEDETGQANLIVHANTWERFHRAARKAAVLQIRGLLQREHGIIHVVVDKLEDLSEQLAAFRSQSRDFR
jgi:error-prone DNA polymerase